LTSDQQTVAARVVAHGRVQGVFYRDTLRRAAEPLGIVGHAVNQPDGTVECVFEGPRDSVEVMIGAAREGSRGSVVDRLDVEWIDPPGANRFATG
jgi:acylphosphatase